MSELFREIEEDIRRERFGKLWQAIGRFAVLGSIGIIILTTIFVIIDGYNERTEQEKTSLLLEGIDSSNAGDYKKAASIFSSLTDDESASYYPIAMLKKAQAQELSGDLEGAKVTYKQLSNHKSVYGDLASLREVGEGSKTESVFHSTYMEKKAWALLAAGNKQEAAKIFMEITKDEKTPESAAKRLAEVVRLLAPEKITEKKAVE